MTSIKKQYESVDELALLFQNLKLTDNHLNQNENKTVEREATLQTVQKAEFKMASSKVDEEKPQIGQKNQQSSQSGQIIRLKASITITKKIKSIPPTVLSKQLSNAAASTKAVLTTKKVVLSSPAGDESTLPSSIINRMRMHPKLRLKKKQCANDQAAESSCRVVDQVSLLLASFGLNNNLVVGQTIQHQQLESQIREQNKSKREEYDEPMDFCYSCDLLHEKPQRLISFITRTKKIKSASQNNRVTLTSVASAAVSSGVSGSGAVGLPTATESSSIASKRNRIKYCRRQSPY